MTGFYINGACSTISGFFSIQSRLNFEGVQEAPSLKQGIRYHNCIEAFILRLFSDTKIVDIKDIDGKTYHINRGSLSNWLKKEHDDLKYSSKEGMLNLSELGMRRYLEDVLAKKSPDYIVNISKIKNDLFLKEEHKIAADRRKGNNSIYEPNLSNEISALKKQLLEAESERLQNKKP